MIAASSPSLPQQQTTLLQVEVVVHPSCYHSMSVIEQNVLRYLQNQQEYKAGLWILPPPSSGESDIYNTLCQHCCSITIEPIITNVTSLPHTNNYSNSTNAATIPFWQVSNIQVHAFVLHTEESEMEGVDDENDDSAACCETLILPHESLQGLWDSIILDETDIIKSNLLQYATTALLFSEAGVSSSLISWNRIILLHGESGTGKTSLCKALAQKLSIRLNKTFQHAQLLEVHSHSLFSKWFSESGKLVAKLFSHIQEIAQDSNTLVCVLVDEVESLVAARSTSIKNGEPSDAIRTVNAMLTAIDRLQKFPNVLILTTTNMSGGTTGDTPVLDLAFMDRADVKQYIGLPPLEARYEILRSCTLELIRCGIVILIMDATSNHSNETKTVSLENNAHTSNGVLPSYKGLCAYLSDSGTSIPNGTSSFSVASLPMMKLLHCSQLADTLSGRSLRKLPFQTHAQFIRSTTVSLADFLDALSQGVLKELSSRSQMMMKQS